MSRLHDTPYVVISSGDDEAELAGICLHYRESDRENAYDLVDLRTEHNAPIRSVYRYHVVKFLQ